MTRRTFYVLLAATLAFRFWLAAALPISGDEAYFIWWGKIPALGYYDHPPMVGWWLAALLTISDSEWWLRLPVIVQPAVMALVVARLLRQPQAGVATTASTSAPMAWGTASILLLAPADLWNVLITTDTPLIYFSFFSGLAYIRAARDDNWRYYLLAGILLAGAILSKYFAVLLGFAYLVHTLIRPGRKKWRGLLVCYAAVLPALLFMAWWNAGHCWANIMFNVYNRNDDAAWSWKTPLLYGVSLLYLLSPPVLWLMWRQRGVLRAHWELAETRALLLIAAVPLLLFAALSLTKEIGLHWPLSFLPFVFIALAKVIEPPTLTRTLKFFGGFAALHVLLIAVVSQLPMETWRKSHLYDGIVLTFEAKELIAKLQPYQQDYVFASDGYSNAVTLGYNARRYFLVFGEGSSHARHDDILTDFRTLAGKNILIVRKSAPQPGEYAPYFETVETRHLDLRGATFYLVLGRGFNYPVYRDRVLTRVREKYYAIPRFLPQRGCYFCARYFPGSACEKSGGT